MLLRRQYDTASGIPAWEACTVCYVQKDRMFLLFPSKKKIKFGGHSTGTQTRWASMFWAQPIVYPFLFGFALLLFFRKKTTGGKEKEIVGSSQTQRAHRPPSTYAGASCMRAGWRFPFRKICGGADDRVARQRWTACLVETGKRRHPFFSHASSSSSLDRELINAAAPPHTHDRTQPNAPARQRTHPAPLVRSLQPASNPQGRPGQPEVPCSTSTHPNLPAAAAAGACARCHHASLEITRERDPLATRRPPSPVTTHARRACALRSHPIHRARRTLALPQPDRACGSGGLDQPRLQLVFVGGNGRQVRRAAGTFGVWPCGCLPDRFASRVPRAGCSSRGRTHRDTAREPSKVSHIGRRLSRPRSPTVQI